MSLYIKCVTCGRLLGDKEIIWLEGIEKINNKNLNKEDYNKELERLMDSMKIPKDNYCCRMRLMSFRDLTKIVK
jgi:DNA-directed RNA polymerase subunit N (RpoN/RPB10)